MIQVIFVPFQEIVYPLPNPVLRGNPVVVCFRGIMPFAQRKKLIEKARSRGGGKKGKSDNKSAGSGGDIVTGAQVCLRSSPIYHVGAVGFSAADGTPKVGMLMEAAWSLNVTCRFKIRHTQP
jgi:E3 ubiquitin-protein ligase EDD1